MNLTAKKLDVFQLYIFKMAMGAIQKAMVEPCDCTTVVERRLQSRVRTLGKALGAGFGNVDIRNVITYNCPKCDKELESMSIDDYNRAVEEEVNGAEVIEEEMLV